MEQHNKVLKIWNRGGIGSMMLKSSAGTSIIYSAGRSKT